MAGYIGGGTSLSILTEQDPSVPSQTGNSGKYLTTDGTDAAWAIVESLPDAIDVNASAPADAIAIDANGRVGINTTPSNPLHVLATAAGETTVKIESNQAGAMFVALDVDTDRDCLLQFQEAGTTRWDIFMNGSSGTNPLLIRDDGGTTQGSFDQSGNFKFNSGYGSAATAYGVRAWGNFNGNGTPAFRASGSSSTISDNGTGDYTVNLSITLPDANYTVILTGGGTSSDNCLASVRHASTYETGRFRIDFFEERAGVHEDPDYCGYAVIR